MNIPNDVIGYILDYLTHLPHYSTVSLSFLEVSAERYQRLQERILRIYPLQDDEPESIKYFIQKAAYLNDWDAVAEISHRFSVEINIYTLSVYHLYGMYNRADRLFHNMYKSNREYIREHISPAILYYLYKLYPSDDNIELLKSNLDKIDPTYVGYISDPIWRDLETLLPELDEEQYEDSDEHSFWIALVAENLNREEDSFIYYRDGALEYARQHRDMFYGDIAMNTVVRKDKYQGSIIEALLCLDVVTPKWIKYVLSLLEVYDEPSSFFSEYNMKNINPLVFELTEKYWIDNVDEVDGYASTYAISQIICALYK